MKPEEVFNPNGESIEKQFSYSGYTEPCNAFVGNSTEPCTRCGFGYFSHTG